jgi:hypothetical protein
MADLADLSRQIALLEQSIVERDRRVAAQARQCWGRIRHTAGTLVSAASTVALAGTALGLVRHVARRRRAAARPGLLARLHNGALLATRLLRWSSGPASQHAGRYDAVLMALSIVGMLVGRR